MIVINPNTNIAPGVNGAPGIPGVTGVFYAPLKIKKAIDKSEAFKTELKLAKKASENNLSFRIAELAGHIKTCDNRCTINGKR